jgi:hypothetical protein
MIVTIEVEDGGPAFPSADNPGMSLRDYFAAKAMQGMMKIHYDMYLLSHPKTPVQARTIAKTWIVSDNKVARVLHRFVENGIADLVRIGTKKFYKVKE